MIQGKTSYCRTLERAVDKWFAFFRQTARFARELVQRHECKFVKKHHAPERVVTRGLLVLGTAGVLSACVGSGPVAQFAGDQSAGGAADPVTGLLSPEANDAGIVVASQDGDAAAVQTPPGVPVPAPRSGSAASAQTPADGAGQVLAAAEVSQNADPAEKVINQAVGVAGNTVQTDGITPPATPDTATGQGNVDGSGLKVVRPGTAVGADPTASGQGNALAQAATQTPQNANPASSKTVATNATNQNGNDAAQIAANTQSAGQQPADATQAESSDNGAAAKKSGFSLFRNNGPVRNNGLGGSGDRGEQFRKRREQNRQTRVSRRSDEGTTTRIASAHVAAKRPKPTGLLAERERKKTKVVFSKRGDAATGNALPGVKSKDELFGIKREGSGSSTSSGSGRTVVASAGSLGRLSPNSLRLQHSKVDVHCLKPDILRIIKIVEKRYGSRPIITSAYRSPKYNRRIGGARNSTHIRCIAVDMQVEGVSKWDLAKFVRSIPGRGGVGTYCRTKSVHVDTSKARDWHHPCRRSKVRKRKKA